MNGSIHIYYHFRHSSIGNECKANSRFQVGRVCLMKVSGRPRPYWNLVKITEILKGRDGEVRVIKIKKSDGSITI